MRNCPAFVHPYASRQPLRHTALLCTVHYNTGAMLSVRDPGARVPTCQCNAHASKKPTCAAGGHAAAEFKDMPGIIGFEIMNEPFAGDIFAQPELVLPGVAGQRNLQKMHDAVAVSSFETARAPAWVPPSKVSFACIGNQPVYDPSVLVGVLWFVCVFCRGRSVRWTRITSSSSSL